MNKIYNNSKFLLINIIVYTVYSIIFQSLGLTVYLHILHVVAAIYFLTFLEGIISLIILGLWIDANIIGINFGISSILMFAVFLMLKNLSLENIMIYFPRRLLIVLNLLMNLLFITTIFVTKKLSFYNIIFCLPTIILSVICVYFADPILYNLRKKFVLKVYEIK